MLKEIILCTFVTALLCSSAASTGQGSDRPHRPAHVGLRKLQPRLSPATAKTLAKAFVRVANESSCGMPWEILASIAFNESSLGFNLVNAKTKDYGLMQISRKNLLLYGLAQDRVMKDATYSIRFACKLLRKNYEQYGAKRPYWLGIYRSGTAFKKPGIIENAIKYDRLIRRTAEQIGYQENYLLVAR